MSNPRGIRFDGGSNSDQMAATLQDAQTKLQYAQAMAVVSQEQANVALLSQYQVAAAANLNAARGCSADVQQQVADFLASGARGPAGLGQVVGIAQGIRMGILPNPRDPSSMNVYTRQFSYDQAAISQALTSADVIASDILSAAPAKAKTIIEAATLAGEPPRPRGLSDDQVESIKADLRAALGANMATRKQFASQLVDQAVTDGDDALLFAMLGKPGKLLLASFQLDRVALIGQYVGFMGDKVQASRPTDYAAGNVAVAGPDKFLTLQGTDNSLAKCIDAADAFLRAQIKSASDLQNTDLVLHNSH